MGGWFINCQQYGKRWRALEGTLDVVAWGKTYEQAVDACWSKVQKHPAFVSLQARP